MGANLLHLLHVGGVILLTAFTFQAFGAAAAGKPKKGGGLITGVLAVLVLGAGFGLVSKLDLDMTAGWLIVKMVCWLGLAAVAGMASKRPKLRGPLALLAIVFLLTAVTMVYYRPF